MQQRASQGQALNLAARKRTDALPGLLAQANALKQNCRAYPGILDRVHTRKEEQVLQSSQVIVEVWLVSNKAHQSPNLTRLALQVQAVKCDGARVQLRQTRYYA